MASLAVPFGRSLTRIRTKANGGRTSPTPPPPDRAKAASLPPQAAPEPRRQPDPLWPRIPVAEMFVAKEDPDGLKKVVDALNAALADHSPTADVMAAFKAMYPDLGHITRGFDLPDGLEEHVLYWVFAVSKAFAQVRRPCHPPLVKAHLVLHQHLGRIKHHGRYKYIYRGFMGRDVEARRKTQQAPAANTPAAAQIMGPPDALAHDPPAADVPAEVLEPLQARAMLGVRNARVAHYPDVLPDPPAPPPMTVLVGGQPFPTQPPPAMPPQLLPPSSHLEAAYHAGKAEAWHGAYAGLLGAAVGGPPFPAAYAPPPYFLPTINPYSMIPAGAALSDILGGPDPVIAPAPATALAAPPKFELPFEAMGNNLVRVRATGEYLPVEASRPLTKGCGEPPLLGLQKRAGKTKSKRRPRTRRRRGAKRRAPADNAGASAAETATEDSTRREAEDKQAEAMWRAAEEAFDEEDDILDMMD